MYHQPPYLREAWHYKVANTNLIRRAINKFDWEKPFSDTNINPILLCTLVSRRVAGDITHPG